MDFSGQSPLGGGGGGTVASGADSHIDFGAGLHNNPGGSPNWIVLAAVAAAAMFMFLALKN